MNKKEYVKRLMIITAVFMFLIVFVSGPINAIFSKYRELKLELPFVGNIVFLIFGGLVEFTIYRYLKPLLKNEQNDARLRESAKQKLFKIPIFTLLLVLVLNLFGPLIIYFYFLYAGRVQVIHYVLGESVIFITTAIFSTLMYFIIHHLTFEFLYESDFLTQEEKEKELPVFVDRKMIIIMNAFSTFAPLLIILMAIELYNVNKSAEQTEIPLPMFVIIALVCGLVVVITQNILSNQWYEKLKKLDVLKHHDKELNFDGKLSPKELSVVKLLVKGYSNIEIGGSLYMSVPAVKKCLSTIYDKLDVKSRSQLIAKCMEKE